MSEYKLVAIDIDGTLLKEDGTISAKTIETINKCCDKNIKVCLCTGRNIRNTVKIAKKLNNGMPFVCADGAIFYDTQNNKIIIEEKLSEETFETIINKANEFNLYQEFCTKKYYIKYCKKEGLEKYSYGKVPKTLVEKFKDYFLKHVRYAKDLEKFKATYKNKINQMILAGEHEELDKIKKYFETANFPDVDIRYDLWDKYIFIVPKGCTKAHGLNIFSNHFNIPIENMIAIGDQMNDIDMIKKAGLGVAMGNAHDEIKANAKFVTKTNDEDGVSFAIEKFIL